MAGGTIWLLFNAIQAPFAPLGRFCLQNRLPGSEWHTIHRDAGCLPSAARSHRSRKEVGNREMVDIHRSGLVLQHNVEDVLCAVELAREADVPAKTHILNLARTD